MKERPEIVLDAEEVESQSLQPTERTCTATEATSLTTVVALSVASASAHKQRPQSGVSRTEGLERQRLLEHCAQRAQRAQREQREQMTDDR